jgi:CBS domain-containing protein
MTKPVLTIGARRPIVGAAQMMFDHPIGALPVLGKGKQVGILTETDVLRAVVPSRIGS